MIGLKLIAALFSGIMILAVFSGLRGRKVEWGRGRQALTIRRSEEPASYWALIVFEISLAILLALCSIYIM